MNDAGLQNVETFVLPWIGKRLEFRTGIGPARVTVVSRLVAMLMALVLFVPAGRGASAEKVVSDEDRKWLDDLLKQQKLR